jgi:glycosyltransferase involved in cell wall biosynthesis
MSPLITVIIATYNSAKTLKWALHSVQQQEFQDFEVRVIGDACTDSSETVVASFNDPRFHWKNLHSNVGSQNGPNNQGLMDALGAYVAYLGHDDLWFPWHLSNLLTCLEKNNADFVFSLCSIFSPAGIQNPMGPAFIDQKTFETRFAPPSSWMHKKELIHTCGFWTCDMEKLKQPIDVEFWQQIVKQKKNFHFCPALSVLKFPSPYWNSYKRAENYPQEPFLDQLFHHPKQLQTQILQDLVSHLNKQIRYRHYGKHWLLKLLQFYGVDRFPLHQLLFWYFHKKRKKIRLQRGLENA